MAMAHRQSGKQHELRIRALNATSSSEDEEEEKRECITTKKTTTKEAQESEAFALYHDALGQQREGKYTRASATLHQLLRVPLITEAPDPPDEGERLAHPGLILKYSSLKNLASISLQLNRLSDALNYYIQAVLVDDTDVTVWFKAGTTACKLHQYSLARHAFEQCLLCNKNHWPSLDKVISILYALGNYPVCLHYIAQALEADPAYIKGIALREQICKEQASLQIDTLNMFENCDPVIYETYLEPEERQQFVDEALVMRKKKQELSKQIILPTVSLPYPLTSLTWNELGQSLVTLYDNISASITQNKWAQSDPNRVKLGCAVDLTPYKNGTIPEGAEGGVSEVKTVMVESAPVMQTTPTKEPTSDTPLIKTQPAGQSEMPADITEEAMETADNSESEGSARRGTKRKRLWWEDAGIKRRSTRVKNPCTVKKKEEKAVNYLELLQQVLPRTMIVFVGEDEGEEEPADMSVNKPMDMATFPAADQDALAQQPSLTDTERNDVSEWLKNAQLNSGVIDLLNRLLIALASKACQKWPARLEFTYREAYNRLRSHIEYPNHLCCDLPDSYIRDMALMCLVEEELQVECWTHKMSQFTGITSPHRSPTKQVSAVLGADFPGAFFKADLCYILGLCHNVDVLGDDWMEYAVRVHWLQARYLVLLNETEHAVDCFNTSAEYLTVAEKETGCPYVVCLPNCSTDPVLSLERAVEREAAMRRCQSLEQVQKLYDEEEYQQVVDLLLETFSQRKRKGMETDISDRQVQLLLLLDALLKLHDHKRCMYWGEVSLHEAMGKCVTSTSQSSKNEWANSITQLCETLDKCIARENNVVGTLPPRHLVRLSANLSRIIELSMDGDESGFDTNVSIVWPWRLLYRLAKSEEKSECEANPDDLPASCTLLTLAHETLGSRSWCAREDGALLIFMVDMLMAKYEVWGEDRPPYADEVDQSLAQCFSCLYNHPSRRKPKHLVDHEVPTMPLKWKDAIKVFEFFKPKTVPEFDSYKTSTVSAELEDLLRRIVSLIPDEQNPAVHYEPVRAYIDGDLNQPPPVPTVDIPVIKEIYYLLADYYFKNKEPQKAIRFYMHDLTLNPDRFDSWAGMALARSSKLEQRLNSLELKADAPIQKQAAACLTCFRQALSLDDTNSALWVENGSLTYQLHAYASRQLKQQRLSDQEVCTSVKSFRAEMLKKTTDCYQQASDCEAEDQEEWLHHYMLGKVAEKEGKSPEVYLEHYTTASEYLHEYGCKYPRKIAYYTPPHLAVEALELYFRGHVAIIKLVMKGEDSVDILSLMEQHVIKAAKSPFVSCRETFKTRLSDRTESDGDEPVASQHSTPPVTTPDGGVSVPVSGGKRPYLPDHSYSLHKGGSSESSDFSSQESMDVSQSGRGGGFPSPPVYSHVAVPLPPSSGPLEPRLTGSITSPVVSKPGKQNAPQSTPRTSNVVQGSGPDKDKGSQDMDVSTGQDEVFTSPSHMPLPTTPSSIMSDSEPSIGGVSCSTPILTDTGKVRPPLLDSPLVSTSLPSTPPVTSTPGVPSRAQHSSTCLKPMNLAGHGLSITALDDEVHQANSSILGELAKAGQLTVPHAEAGTGRPGSAGFSKSEAVVVKGDARPKSAPSLRDMQQRSMGSGIKNTPESYNRTTKTSVDNQLKPLKSTPMQPTTAANEQKQSQSTTQSQLSTAESEPICIEDSDEENAAKSDSGSDSSEDTSDEDDSSESGSTETTTTSGSGSEYTDASTSDDEDDDDDDDDEEDADEAESVTVNSAEKKNEDIAVDQVMKKPVDQVPVDVQDKESGASTGTSGNTESVTKGTRPVSDIPTKTDTDGPIDTLIKTENVIAPENQLGIVSSSTLTSDVDMKSEIPPVTESDVRPVAASAISSCVYMLTELESISPAMSDECISPLDSNFPALAEPLASSTQSTIPDVAVTDIKPQVSAPDTTVTEVKSPSSVPNTAASDVKVPYTAPNTSATEVKAPPIATNTAVTDVKSPPSVSNTSVTDVKTTSSAPNTSVTSVKTTSSAPNPSVTDVKQPSSAPNTSVTDVKAPSSAPNTSLTDIKPLMSELGQHLSGKKDVILGSGLESRATGDVTAKTIDIKEEDLSDVIILDSSSETSDERTKNSGRMDTSVETVDEDIGDQSKAANIEKKSADVDKESAASQGDKKVTDSKNLKPPGADVTTRATSAVKSTLEEKRTDKEQLGKRPLSPAFRRLQLLDACIEALHLCLSRFPQHYKSIYRLATIYYKSTQRKDLNKAKDLLVGCQDWPQKSHMPCQGLFHDRKNTNFFQGLWKIPIEEIDRAGSFATHLAKAVRLLLEISRDKKDCAFLFHAHNQLVKTPDLGKKYLREGDRETLSQLAYEYCLDALQTQIREDCTDSWTATSQVRDQLLLCAHRVWQYGNRKKHSEKINRIFVSAYLACTKTKATESGILDKAVAYCQQLQASQTYLYGENQVGQSDHGMMSPMTSPTSVRGSPAWSGASQTSTPPRSLSTQAALKHKLASPSGSPVGAKKWAGPQPNPAPVGRPPGSGRPKAGYYSSDDVVKKLMHKVQKEVGGVKSGSAPKTAPSKPPEASRPSLASTLKAIGSSAKSGVAARQSSGKSEPSSKSVTSAVTGVGDVTAMTDANGQLTAAGVAALVSVMPGYMTQSSAPEPGEITSSTSQLSAQMAALGASMSNYSLMAGMQSLQNAAASQDVWSADSGSVADMYAMMAASHMGEAYAQAYAQAMIGQSVASLGIDKAATSSKGVSEKSTAQRPAATGVVRAGTSYGSTSKQQGATKSSSSQMAGSAVIGRMDANKAGSSSKTGIVGASSANLTGIGRAKTVQSPSVSSSGIGSTKTTSANSSGGGSSTKTADSFKTTTGGRSSPLFTMKPATGTNKNDPPRSFPPYISKSGKSTASGNMSVKISAPAEKMANAPVKTVTSLTASGGGAAYKPTSTHQAKKTSNASGSVASQGRSSAAQWSHPPQPQRTAGSSPSKPHSAGPQPVDSAHRSSFNQGNDSDDSDVIIISSQESDEEII